MAAPAPRSGQSTAYDYLDLWDWDGTLERIHHALYVASREQANRLAKKRAQRRRSSTPKAPKGLKKGAFARSIGL